MIQIRWLLVASASFDADRLRRHAERFSRARFDEQMQALIADTLDASREQGDQLFAKC